MEIYWFVLTYLIYIVIKRLKLECIFICGVFLLYVKILYFFHGSTAPSRPKPAHSWGFEITLSHTTLCRAPLYEWSACRRDVYLTTSNAQKKQTSMFPAWFEPVTPASQRPQTQDRDGAATGFGLFGVLCDKFYIYPLCSDRLYCKYTP